MINIRYLIIISILIILFNCTDEERKAFEKKILNKYSGIPKVEGILSEREVLRIVASDSYNVSRLKHHFGDIRNLAPGIFVLVEDHRTGEFYYFVTVHHKDSDVVATYQGFNAYSGERTGGGGIFFEKEDIKKGDLLIFISKEEAVKFFNKCKYKKKSGKVVNIKAVLPFQGSELRQSIDCWFWCIETGNGDVYMLNPYYRLASIKDRNIKNHKIWYYIYGHRLYKVEDKKQKEALKNFEYNITWTKIKYGIIENNEENWSKSKFVVPKIVKISGLTPLDDF